MPRIWNIENNTYYPIWKQLKLHGECHVALDSRRHYDLKRAVIKEKDKDTAYKITLREQDVPQTSRLKITSSGNKLSFKLVFYDKPAENI